MIKLMIMITLWLRVVGLRNPSSNLRTEDRYNFRPEDFLLKVVNKNFHPQTPELRVFDGVVNVHRCLRMCWYATECGDVVYKSTQRQCLLLSKNKTAPLLVPDAAATVYASLRSIQMGLVKTSGCAQRLCGDGDFCVPTAEAASFHCIVMPTGSAAAHSSNGTNATASWNIQSSTVQFVTEDSTIDTPLSSPTTSVPAEQTSSADMPVSSDVFWMRNSKAATETATAEITTESLTSTTDSQPQGGISCSTIHVIKGGNITWNTTGIGNLPSGYLVCDSDYVLVGKSVVNCDANTGLAVLDGECRQIFWKAPEVPFRTDLPVKAVPAVWSMCIVGTPVAPARRVTINMGKRTTTSYATNDLVLHFDIRFNFNPNWQFRTVMSSRINTAFGAAQVIDDALKPFPFSVGEKFHLRFDAAGSPFLKMTVKSGNSTAFTYAEFNTNSFVEEDIDYVGIMNDVTLESVDLDC